MRRCGPLLLLCAADAARVVVGATFSSRGKLQRYAPLLLLLLWTLWPHQARERYDLRGKDGIEEGGMIDPSTFYQLVFGSENFEVIRRASPPEPESPRDCAAPVVADSAISPRPRTMLASYSSRPSSRWRRATSRVCAACTTAVERPATHQHAPPLWQRGWAARAQNA